MHKSHYSMFQLTFSCWHKHTSHEAHCRNHYEASRGLNGILLFLAKKHLHPEASISVQEMSILKSHVIVVFFGSTLGISGPFLQRREEKSSMQVNKGRSMCKLCRLVLVLYSFFPCGQNCWDKQEEGK